MEEAAPPIEQLGHVTPGRLMLEILREDEMSGLIVRPENARGWHPIARIIQVGEGVEEPYAVGRWVYVSQYVGETLSTVGERDPRKGRLVCEPSDLLAIFEENDEVEAICAALLA